ncbi:hypothetical protein [Mesorhizobium sp. M1409]
MTSIGYFKNLPADDPEAIVVIEIEKPSSYHFQVPDSSSNSEI